MYVKHCSNVSFCWGFERDTVLENEETELKIQNRIPSSSEKEMDITQSRHNSLNFFIQARRSSILQNKTITTHTNQMNQIELNSPV